MKIIGGAAAGWLLAARAQQRERLRSIALLSALAKCQRLGMKQLQFVIFAQLLGINPG